ncbi:MAG: gamma-glutamyl-phosphate reductase, partial [Alphaproteobacteria bacterium]|nr:gamma-glutamyl-phosphate reductase [Alphaproteobacteria bacterium]
MNIRTGESETLNTEMLAIGRAARLAARALADAPAAARNRALTAAAKQIRATVAAILAANADDLSAARASGMKDSMVDRLKLDPARIEAIAKGLEDVAALPDPVGRELARWQRPNGLDIS